MTATGLDATIVVPSIAADALLIRCVRTCRRLYPDVEIVALIDDAAGAAAIEVLATVVASGPSTIGAKRNRGVEMSSTAYVAFIDSDAYPEAGWLERAITHLEASASGASVGPTSARW